MLNNTFLQVAVGFIPAALFFLIISIIRKKNRRGNIAATIFFFSVIGILAVPQLLKLINKETANEYDALSLVYAVAEEDSTELAKSMLDDLRTDYKPEYALAAARIAAKSGDYQAAKALYLKAMPLFPESEEEYMSVNALCEAEEEFYGISDHLNAQTIYTEREELLSDTIKSLSRVIDDSVLETEDDIYDDMAEYIVYADHTYEAFLNDSVNDIEEVKKKRRRLDNFLEENPGMLGITQVRLARMKLQLLCADYKDIAASVSEASDYHELLIVSELYLNNYVKQSHFSDEFTDENEEKYEVVYEKLFDIYNDHYRDKPREVRNKAKAQLNAIETTLQYPALGKMLESLSEYAAEDYAIDSSKVYLQMAKIEHSLGNEPKSVEYIDRSIDTVGDCEDNDYTVPMYELVGIIADKDDPERLKSVAVYVDQVLENNMTIKLKEVGAAVEAEEADEDDKKKGKNSLAGDFAAQMQTYVSQKRMSVNIINVDTTDFDENNTIRATVNISNNLYNTVDELKAAISLKDCGVDIADFTVDKVNYTGANILLCVDTSGSMEGYKIENLINAIKFFAAEKTGIENIALVTFSSGVENDYPFGLTIDELTAAADAIDAYGNTAIYHSVLHSIDKFTNKPGVINSIIVMSDGLDGYTASMEEIEENIGKACREKDITVYAIGFGNDADGTYLSSIATSTGGAYLYANEPTADSQVNQLSEFFDGLRAQILNQYIITFTANDTLSYSRELKVAVGDGLDSDRVTYYLGGGSDSIIEPEFNEASPVYMSGKAVNGFSPSLLYKNGKTLTTSLKGAGFSAGDSFSISLKGNSSGVEWDLGSSYVDENTVSVTIPAGIGVDVYDVHVSINGKTAVLPKGLSIFTQGNEKITDFGPYRFVSYTKLEDKENSTVTLSGYVTMNGWLSFNDKITLSGDLKSGRITLSDFGGSRIRYDVQNAEGLAVVLAKMGMPVYVPALGQISLYNDSEYEKQFADFRVEAFPLNALDLGKYFRMTDIEVKIYPNRIAFDSQNIMATLPFANNILTNKADLFSFDYAFGGTVSSKSIGIKIDLEYSPGDTLGATYFPVGLGNMPIYISPQDTELHINTFDNDYEFKFMVKTAFLAGQKALGLSAKWDNPDSGDRLTNHSNGLVPTEIKLYADFDVDTYVSGVPVTYSDFMVGIEDIDTSKSPLYWTLVGGCDISAAKLSAIPGLSGLEEWIGDVSVLKLDDAKLSLNLGEFYMKADTTLKLFEELDCGSVLVEMGKFSYTSALLNMNDEAVAGLRFVGTLGPDWQFGKSSLKLQVTGEFDAISKFIGLQGKGEFDAKFKVWIISIGTSMQGEIAVGVRITSDGTVAFIVRSKPALPKGGLTWPKNAAGKL
jgi:Mg-chelatase subunit ChlD